MVGFNVGKSRPSHACNNPISNYTTCGQPESSKYRLLSERGSLAITNKSKWGIDEDSRNSSLAAFLISISTQEII
jgi:hypothetical protein